MNRSNNKTYWMGEWNRYQELLHQYPAPHIEIKDGHPYPSVEQIEEWQHRVSVAYNKLADLGVLT